MATGVVSWSQTAASNATADSTVNWAEGQAPSSVNDSARAVMASVAKFRDDTNGSLTTGGTSAALTLTTNQGFASLTALNTHELAFTMHTTSGATPTLSVDSLTAKPIRHATGATLPTGALLSGSVYHVKYDNVNGEFLLTNQLAKLTVADGAIPYSKIQDVTASRLLGNPTGSAAAPSEISLGAGLAFSSTTLVGVTNPNELAGYLSGLTLSTAGSSATMSIAIGAANDVSNGGIMSLTSAISKTTSSWAVGTGNGGLDTGAIATSTWYHFFLIKRTDTGVVDVLFSLSATAPTMPTNYTLKRRIGSMKTNGSSQWTSFTQYGDKFIWATEVTDVNAVTPTNGATNSVTLTVPTGVVVEAMLRAHVGFVSGSATTFFIWPGIVSTPSLATQFANVAGNVNAAAGLRITTDTSAAVNTKLSYSGSTSYTLITEGWIDTRGK